MKQGDNVRFINPTDEEKELVFEVLEDRDSRVLVRALNLFDDWEVKPTSVYLKKDLKIVNYISTLK